MIALKKELVQLFKAAFFSVPDAEPSVAIPGGAENTSPGKETE